LRHVLFRSQAQGEGEGGGGPGPELLSPGPARTRKCSDGYGSVGYGSDGCGAGQMPVKRPEGGRIEPTTAPPPRTGTTASSSSTASSTPSASVCAPSASAWSF